MARQHKPPTSSASAPSAASASASASAFTSASLSSADAQVKHRVQVAQPTEEETTMPGEDIPMSEHPLVAGGSEDGDAAAPVKPHAGGAARSKWIVLAIASGACAAFNGVFAKLATGDLTASIAKGVAHFLHLSAAETVVNIVVRCIFFGLNLAFNGIMWALFTKALARGTSTTQVAIMNTSSNFVLTAVLGFAIFSESLPPLWWLGASLLIVGNVIIGQKDEGSSSSKATSKDGEPAAVVDGAAFRDVDEHDGPAEEDGSGAYRDAALTDRMLAKQLEKDDEEDVLDLGHEHR